MRAILESIKSYIGYIMAVVGIVSFIYSQGVKAEARRTNNVEVSNQIEMVIIEQNSQSKQLNDIESRILLLSDKLNNVSDKQDAQAKSYKNYLMRDSTLTVKQFLEYMEGFSIEKKMEFPKTKIIITPIK